MNRTIDLSKIFPSRRDGLAALLIAAATLPGCSGLRDMRDRDDWLGDLVEPLVPMTPGEAARSAINVYDADKRRRGVAALGGASFGGNDAYVRLYRLLIDDPDPTVRAACAKALGLHGLVEDAARIIPLLNDDDPYVRWEAATALQRIHEPAAALPLVEAVSSDEDSDVRMAAALALGQYRQPAVFDALVGALTDTDFGVAYAARYALHILTGKDQGPHPRNWLTWAEQNRGNLFADAQTYTYLPYDPPETFWQKIRFWEKNPPPQREKPVGLDVASSADQTPEP